MAPPFRVIRRSARDHRAMFVTGLLHNLARRAEDNRIIRDFLAWRDERVRTDNTIASDFGVIEDDATDADQGVIGDFAAMQHHHMADADIVA